MMQLLTLSEIGGEDFSGQLLQTNQDKAATKKNDAIHLENGIGRYLINIIAIIIAPNGTAPMAAASSITFNDYTHPNQDQKLLLTLGDLG